MGLLKGIGSIVGLDDLVAEVGKTVRQVLPDPQARREIELKLSELQDKAEARMAAEVQGQLEINKLEAQHASVFVAGWRPFIGWVCGYALAWNLLLSPALTALFGTPLSVLNVEYVMTLAGVLLGSSAIRTYERKVGISRDNLKIPSAKQQAAMTAVEAETDPTDNLDEEDAPWTRR